jgi:iron complex transport system substrate-binding protein
VWASVAAVRAGRVHLSPKMPFGWVDFPPSVNRLIGCGGSPRSSIRSNSRGHRRADPRFLHALLSCDADDAQIEHVLAGRD